MFPPPVNDMIVAAETAVGEDKVSGLMFADDFVGISETPKGLQKIIEKALSYARNGE